MDFDDLNLLWKMMHEAAHGVLVVFLGGTVHHIDIHPDATPGANMAAGVAWDLPRDKPLECLLAVCGAGLAISHQLPVSYSLDEQAINETVKGDRDMLSPMLESRNFGTLSEDQINEFFELGVTLATKWIGCANIMVAIKQLAIVLYKAYQRGVCGPARRCCGVS